MFILMGFLLMGVKFEPSSLVDLKGKWTVGVGIVGSIYKVPSSYSISWRPWKTFRIEIIDEGSLYDRPYDYDDVDKEWNISIGIGFYKYFRAHSSVSPFVGLVPGFSENYSYYAYSGRWYENSTQSYSISLAPGVEYFFGMFGKQWSLRFKTSLLSASRSYVEESFSNVEPRTKSYIQNKISFNLSSEGSFSTWLCFHF